MSRLLQLSSYSLDPSHLRGILTASVRARWGTLVGLFNMGAGAQVLRLHPPFLRRLVAISVRVNRPISGWKGSA